MPRIPARYGHMPFGVIQSGITSGISAGVASLPFLKTGGFLIHWLPAWLVSWAIMLPIVIALAPLIRRAVMALTTASSGA